MEKQKKPFFTARYVAYLGVLLALVIVFQMASGLMMKFNVTTFCFALVPIVLGSVILGVVAGAILGAAFGIVVIICGATGLDGFTLYLLNQQPAFTVLLCLLKGVAAGVVPALIYKLISKKNNLAAVITASLVAPIINTGIFAIGAFIAIKPIIDFLTPYMPNVGSLSPAHIVFVVVITTNFFIEFAISAVFAPAVYTVERVVKKRIEGKKQAAKQPVQIDATTEQRTVNNDNLS